MPSLFAEFNFLLGKAEKFERENPKPLEPDADALMEYQRDLQFHREAKFCPTCKEARLMTRDFRCNVCGYPFYEDDSIPERDGEEEG